MDVKGKVLLQVFNKSS